MDREACVELGYISRPHGLKGEVKAVFDVHDLREYLRVRTLYLAKAGQPLMPVAVRRITPQSASLAVVQFADTQTREAAEALAGSIIYFPSELLPKLEPGRFYYYEIFGYTVQDAALGPVGTVKDVLDGTAQDLLVISSEGREILAPVTDEFVLRADHEARMLHTALPPGLVDFYLGRESAEDEEE
jgi:16S rRNA processing protein RimM